MKGKTIVKTAIDAAMFALFLLLMAQYLLADAPHEWLGIALGILFLAHNGLNYRWYAALFRGKYGALRIVQTTIDFLLCIAMLGCMASGILVSENIFPLTSGAAYESGRRLHLVATAWAFLLMCLHLGLHWAQFTGMAKRVPLGKNAKTALRHIFRALVLALCIAGLFLLIERRFWEELFYFLLLFLSPLFILMRIPGHRFGSVAVIFSFFAYHAPHTFLLPVFPVFDSVVIPHNNSKFFGSNPISRKNSPNVLFTSRMHFSGISILRLISSLREMNPCHNILFAFARSCIALSSCNEIKPSSLNTPVDFSKYAIISSMPALQIISLWNLPGAFRFFDLFQNVRYVAPIEILSVRQLFHQLFVLELIRADTACQFPPHLYRPYFAECPHTTHKT